MSVSLTTLVRGENHEKKKTDDYLIHHGVKGQRWGVRKATGTGVKKVSNRQITKDMNSTYKKKYKELYNKYNAKDPVTSSDRAYKEAKRYNTKHLIDTYGKERMDKYYSDEHKKTMVVGAFLVTSMAGMSAVAMISNKVK